MAHIPIVSLWGEKSPGFSLTLPLFNDLIMGVLYGDLLMRVVQRIRPYEKVQGSTDELYAYWVTRCQQALYTGNRRIFKKYVYEIVQDFDRLPIYDTLIKIRVGIVGEILVKYHPVANNHIVKLLELEQPVRCTSLNKRACRSGSEALVIGQYDGGRLAVNRGNRSATTEWDQKYSECTALWLSTESHRCKGDVQRITAMLPGSQYYFAGL